MAAITLAKVEALGRPAVLTIPSPHGRATVTILEFLFERGRQMAVQGRVLEARQEDLEALSGLGRAYASGTSVREYDPGSIGSDGDRKNLFEGLRAASRRLNETIRNVGASMHDAAQKSAAKAAQLGEKPDLPLIIIVTSAVVIAMTIAASTHDLVFTTLRDDLNWTLSLMLGVIIGGMLAWGLIAESAKTFSPKSVALWGGIILGGGFAILRLSAAEEFGEVVYAVGLSAIEIGTVVFAEAIGTRYQSDLACWQERNEAAGDAAGHAESSRKMYERLVSEKAAVDKSIEDHLAYADDRRELSGDVTRREAACVAAACAGYWRGIAENIGRAQGGDHDA